MHDKKPNEKNKNKIWGILGIFLMLFYFVAGSIIQNYFHINNLILIIFHIIGILGLILTFYAFGEDSEDYPEYPLIKEKQQNLNFRIIKKVLKISKNFIFKNKRKIILILFTILLTGFITNLYFNNKKSEIYCLSNTKYNGDYYKVGYGEKLRLFQSQEEALLYCKKIIFPKIKEKKDFSFEEKIKMVEKEP